MATGKDSGMSSTLRATVDQPGSTSDDVLFRVTSVGGIAPGRLLVPPALSLLRDGRLIEATGSDPLRNVTPLLVRTLTGKGLAAINHELDTVARSADDVADPATPDATALVVSGSVGETPFVWSFRTLEPLHGDSPRRAAFRSRVRLLIDHLKHVESRVGPDNVSSAVTLAPKRVAVNAAPAFSATGAKAWTLSSIRLRDLARPPSCTVIDEPLAEQLFHALDGTTAATVWHQNDDLWRVSARLLLPDETGCAGR
jgi:hypothetical protein